MGEVDVGSASADAERAMASVFLACRLGQLVFSALMVAGDRRRYRSAKVQLALLGGSVLESAWLARRILRAGRYQDRTAMWTDTVWSAAGLLACEAALGAGGAAPWMKNIAIGSALGAASPEGRVDGVAAMGLLGIAGAVAGVGASGRDAHVAGLALAANDVISWTGMGAAARIYVESHRRSARLRDEAGALVLSRAREAASQDERSRQQRRLHQVTVETLEAIAGGDDPLAAGRVARQEAARLRHALRTRGEVRTGLHVALCDIVEAVSELGLRVELVTVELETVPTTEVADALCDAVLTSLLTAREFGEAARAIVRAVGDSDRVVVTIRDRGAGFEPGRGSGHESRLMELGRRLAAVGGTVQVWSAPGRGSRVTLEAPAADLSSSERGGDDTSNGVPILDRRGGAARDDHGLVGNGDVDRRAVRGLIGAAQHDARPIEFDDPHTGTHGESLEPGPQQRPGGDDASRGSIGHRSTMAARSPRVVGRTTPFGPEERPAHDEAFGAYDETARAERTILAAVLAWRFTGIATGLAALVAGQRRYRSRASGMAQLAVAAGESIWLARRVWRRSTWTSIETTVDACTAAAMLAWGRANLAPADRQTWLNWAPWSFAANAITGQGIGPDRLVVGAAGASAISAVNASVNFTASDIVANSGAMAAFFAGGRLFAHQIRVGATRLEAAQAEAVRAGAVLAAERERASQLRVLHDGALQTLEAVGSGRFHDMTAIRTQAKLESEKLRREIEGVDAFDSGLLDRIGEVVRSHTVLGLDVDLRCAPALVPGPSPAVARALCDACHEALVNVRKHAGTDRVTVEVAVTPAAVEVIVADRGFGFDPDTVPAGFGLAESITARITAVGGTAEIIAAPGKGTTVILRTPR
ncbi:MAG: sensor histidine kinase [Acidimicrobiales bacterium]